MNKTIVTHIRPDFDALIAVWLIKRYYPGFDKAGVTFVPAGETYEKQGLIHRRASFTWTQGWENSIIISFESAPAPPVEF